MRMLRKIHEKNQVFSDHGCRIGFDQQLQLQVFVAAQSIRLPFLPKISSLGWVVYG
jgi:hypothetical protein